MGTAIIVGVIVSLLVIFIALGFRIVRQAETMVIERLDAYHKTLKSGVNFIFPMLDKEREIEWRYIKTDLDGRTIIRKAKITRIDLRETVYDFPKQTGIITKVMSS